MKSKQTPIRRTQTSDPAKMRQDIIRQFETLPDDTRDIIAQFYIANSLSLCGDYLED